VSPFDLAQDKLRAVVVQEGKGEAYDSVSKIYLTLLMIGAAMVMAPRVLAADGAVSKIPDASGLFCQL
jgi:hypothetical protein